jgi:uncharacterized protein (TIGR02145 family)
MIASRVIRLTLGCVSRCNEPERCLEVPCDIIIVPNPSTTSTSSTSTSTTSTTTTAVPTTTTTSSSSSTTTTTTTVCQDCLAFGFANPDNGNGSKTLPNGLTITTTYVGPPIAAPVARTDSFNCVGFPIDKDFLILGTPIGPYTLTIDFSYPVNNIYITTVSMGGSSGLGISECFTIESNQGTPTVTEIAGCYDFGVVGNVVCGSFQGGNTGGAVNVFTPTPYTQLIITGQWVENTADGFGFDLCFPNCSTTTTSSTSSSTTTSTTTIPPTSTTTTSSTSSTTTTSTTLCPGCTTTTTTTSCNTCVGPPTVVIGTQTWTTCNLNVTAYRNGDPIPEVTDPAIWETLTTGAWCYYNNDPLNGPIYGKLYNWFAVVDPRGLAPVGYHIPSDDEWSTLTNYLGGPGQFNTAGGKMKEAGLCHWQAPNTDATNSSGFAALPGGYNWWNAGFYNIGIQANFWSSTELPPPYTDHAYVYYSYYANAYNWRGNNFKPTGYSVRLIAGDTPTTTTTTLAPSGINTIYTHFEAL